MRVYCITVWVCRRSREGVIQKQCPLKGVRAESILFSMLLESPFKVWEALGAAFELDEKILLSILITAASLNACFTIPFQGELKETN